MKSILLFFAFASSIFINAQINQLDSAGKKHGKWKLYLDAYGKKLDDSTKASYWRYTIYDHGTHVYPMGGFIKKGESMIGTELAAVTPGNPKMLHGIYKCYDKAGILKFMHVFENGNYVTYTEFYKDGTRLSHFDYTDFCDDGRLSWRMTTYDKTGKVTYHECIRKDPTTGKWPYMRG